jgi:hypothetical protein
MKERTTLRPKFSGLPGDPDYRWAAVLRKTMGNMSCCVGDSYRTVKKTDAACGSFVGFTVIIILQNGSPLYSYSTDPGSVIYPKKCSDQ